METKSSIKRKYQENKGGKKAKEDIYKIVKAYLKKKKELDDEFYSKIIHYGSFDWDNDAYKYFFEKTLGENIEKL